MEIDFKCEIKSPADGSTSRSNKWVIASEPNHLKRFIDSFMKRIRDSNIAVAVWNIFLLGEMQQKTGNMVSKT